mgnify:CR=1 FL=1
MITIEKRLELPESYPLSRIGTPDQLLIFRHRDNGAVRRTFKTLSDRMRLLQEE